MKYSFRFSGVEPEVGNIVGRFAAMQKLIAEITGKYGVLETTCAIDSLCCGPLPFYIWTSRKLIDELNDLDTHNRTPKEHHIKLLSRSMADNNWMCTNQGVGVCVDGYIIDGGNRIKANIAAGYPSIQILLVLGLEPKSQKYVDTHIAKRSVTDTLKLILDINTNTLIVATINVLLKFQSNWSTYSFTVDEVANFLIQNDGILTSVINVQKAKNLPAPVIAGCVYTILKNGDECKVKVLEFLEQVINGEMLTKGDPALTFRNWLFSSRGATGGAEIQKERFYKTLAAVNAHLEGRSLAKIVAKKTGLKIPSSRCVVKTGKMEATNYNLHDPKKGARDFHIQDKQKKTEALQ